MFYYKLLARDIQTLCRVESALEIVEETSGDGQVPVPLRPSSSVRVMVVLLSLLPRRTVAITASTNSYAAAATAASIGTCASSLLAVMMVLGLVVTVMMMVMVVMLLRSRPVLVLLCLLPVVPPFPTVVLMRYHAVHDDCTADVVVRSGRVIRSSHAPRVPHPVNGGSTRYFHPRSGYLMTI